MEDQFYEDLKEKIQEHFEDVGGHEFAHTQRVYNLAVHIAESENVDLDVVKASALLHDIARKKQDEVKEVICHAEEGAKMAREILEKTGFQNEKIENVCYAIKVHRYSKGLTPNTIEAKILQDADRLDALGAIGLARIFNYDGKNNRPMYDPNISTKEYVHNHKSETGINHIYEKILNIKPETFYTEKAREIARGRYDFVKEFVERFLKEWEGEL